MDLKVLLEKEVLSDETKNALLEAWENKLKITKEEITENLREEFASRYEHDKSQIVEAADKFLTEELQEKVKDLIKEKQDLVKQKKINEAKFKNHLEENVKNKKYLIEGAQTFIKNELQIHLKDLINERNKIENDKKNAIKTFETIAQKQLSGSVKNITEDRNTIKDNLKKVEDFMLRSLAEEISEFRDSKRLLEEDRTNVLRAQNKVILEAKNNFVKRSAALVENVLENAIKVELKQLNEDIIKLKKNAFGMKIFEAFAAEFMASHYNEGDQIIKFKNLANKLSNDLNETKNTLNQKNIQLKETQKQASMDKILKERSDIMNNLLAPLPKDKKQIMERLLETVPNDKLRDSHRKYLPMVINEKVQLKIPVITEKLTEQTGDRKNLITVENNTAEIIELRRLTGNLK